MDLSKYTQMDLLDLRREINEELESYENRSKTKVFTVFIAFIGTKYFLKKENAIQYLKESIDEDLVFDGNEVKCDEKYINEAEIESYCYDYAV